MTSPAWPTAPKPAPRRCQAGTTVVEFALILVVFFTLIFAVFDFGIYMNSREAVRHGVREAGRTAVVKLVPTGETCSTTPAMPSGPDKDLVCLVKSKIGQAQASTRVDVLFPDSDAKAGHHISICASYATSGSTAFTAPFIPTRVTSETTLLLEQTLPGVTISGTQGVSETGVDWSFCR